MTQVRLLVGTRKGAFVLTSDGARRDWTVGGPFFGGWEIYHLNGSPADPQRLYASQSSGWHGQVVQRSDDGGATWEPVGNDFVYGPPETTHADYDGTQIPWKFTRVWHLEPSPTEPDVVYAGVQDAGLFRSADGGRTWEELPALRTHPTHELWAPGAGGHCLHTILIDPADATRMYVAISAAGMLKTQDAGASWSMHVNGLTAEYLPEQPVEAGYCVHRLAVHPSRVDTLFMQHHGGVYRTDDAGGVWTDVSDGLPSDFGFPIAVHAHEAETVYVVPLTAEERVPPDGKLRVYRSRSGGGDWEPLGEGLPDRDCYVGVLRDAMAVDTLDECGVYFGTTGGQVFASPDSGRTWSAAARHLPAVLSVEVQTIG